MAAHRYWRVLVNDSPNPQAYALEIEMRASPGGPDVTSSANAIDGGSFTGYEGDKAFDNGGTGFSEGWWVNGASGGWVGQDFGSAQEVQELTYRGGSNTRSPTSFDIQYSDDGTNWTTTDTYSGLTWASYETKTFAVTDPDGGGGGGDPGAFKILRGSSIIAASADTLTLTKGVDFTLESGIASDAWFFIITSNHNTGMGSTSGGSQAPDDVTVTVEYSGSNVVLTRALIGGGGNNRVDWQIVQYVGGAGGPNEIKVREKGVTTLTGISQTVALPGTVGAAADVVPFITGQRAETSANGNYNQAIHTSDISGSDAVFQRGGSGNDSHVSYALVEFTGSNWSITKQAIASGRSGATQSFTLDTALTDFATAFIHATYRHESGAGLDDMSKRVRLTSDTAIEVHSGTSSSVADERHIVWIIENPETSVARYSGTMAGASEEEVDDITITAVSDLDQTLLTISADSTGSGTAFPRGFINALLTDATTVRLRQSDNGQTSDYALEVIAMPTTAGGGGGGADFEATPGPGAASGAGQTPTANAEQSVTVEPGTGGASGAGQGADASAGSTAEPGTGAATGQGTAPTVGTGTGATVEPGTGSATGSGEAPEASADTSLSAGAGAATGAGQAPSLTLGNSATVEPGEGTAVGGGEAPGVSTDVEASPGEGGATGAGETPTVTTDSSFPATVTPDAGSATGSGESADLSTDAGVRPEAGGATGSGAEPRVATETTETPGTGSATGQGHAPEVAAGAGTDVQPGTGAGTGAGEAGGVAADAGATPGAGAATGAGEAPEAGADATLASDIGSAAGAGHAPEVVIRPFGGGDPQPATWPQATGAGAYPSRRFTARHGTATGSARYPVAANSGAYPRVQHTAKWGDLQ